MHRNIFEEEHEIFRDSVVKFLHAEVTPHLERWLEAGIVDRELFRKAGEQGYCLMWADEAYGGMGVHDFRFEQILIEENAFHGDAGFGLSLHSRLCAPYIGQLGNEGAHEILPPRRQQHAEGGEIAWILGDHHRRDGDIPGDG